MAPKVIISVSPKLKTGDRVVFKARDNEWYTGTVSFPGNEVRKTRLLLDTGVRELVERQYLADLVKPISSVRRNKRVLTDADAAALYSSVVVAVPAKTISLKRPTKISMKIIPRASDLKATPDAAEPVEARAPREVIVKEIPDYTKLVDLTTQWVMKQNELAPKDRKMVLDSLVDEVHAMDIAVKLSNTLSPLYRAVELPTKKLKLALDSKYVANASDRYTSWMRKPSATHSYLDRYRYGVVTSWSPIAWAVVVDIAAMLEKISKTEGAVAKLGGPKQQKAFEDLKAAALNAQEVILRTPPPQTPVMGLVSNSKQFIRSMSQLNVRHVLSPDQASVYVTLFDLQDSTDELGLA